MERKHSPVEDNRPHWRRQWTQRMHRVLVCWPCCTHCAQTFASRDITPLLPPRSPSLSQPQTRPPLPPTLATTTTLMLLPLPPPPLSPLFTPPWMQPHPSLTRYGPGKTCIPDANGTFSCCYSDSSCATVPGANTTQAVYYLSYTVCDVT